ncbi:MAG: cupin domain-containing protein [Microbacterium sp.]|uniref:cupin domain-containing protein n=1 Tax=Microbacterium sp. TaxID=51671 RepID=UPI003D6F20A3
MSESEMNAEGKIGNAEWVEDPLFRQRYRFEHEGDHLKIEIETQPGGGVLSEHIHPGLQERYRILEGQLTFELDGEKRPAGPGDELVVEPGARHRFENTGPGPSRLLVEARPPMRLRESIEKGARMTAGGRFTAGGRPKTLPALLQAADFSLRYRDTVVLTSPPPALQGVLFGPLAALYRFRHKR